MTSNKYVLKNADGNYLNYRSTNTYGYSEAELWSEIRYARTFTLSGAKNCKHYKYVIQKPTIVEVILTEVTG